MTVVETLRSMGLSDADIACQEAGDGWRIRAQGGLIVHMRKDGQLTVSGKNTHAVRKALGLTSRKLKPG
jgi:predicted nucleotide-binding protein